MFKFKKNTKLKPGDLALYKRTGEVVLILEHKMPKQVTISIGKDTEAFNKNFKYIDFFVAETSEEILKNLHRDDLQVTISIDELELLPDRDIAKLLY